MCDQSIDRLQRCPCPFCPEYASTQIDSLPDDCLLHIFFHFSIQEKVRFQSINRRWSRLLKFQIAFLQKRITIWYPIDNEVDMLRYFQQVHWPHLLPRLDFLSNGLLAQSFKGLRKLRLLGVNLPGLYTSCFIDNLLTPHLQHLALLYCSSSINPIISEAANKCLELKEIELLCVGGHALHEPTLNEVLTNLKHLHTFRVGFVWNNVGWVHPIRCERLPNIAQQLKALQLSDCAGLRAPVFRSIVKEAALTQNLKALQFDLREGLSGNELKLVCSKLTSLESLVLCVSRADCITDVQFASIAKLINLTRLELVLRAPVSLSEESLRHVMIGCTKVRMFGIVHFGPLLGERTLVDISDYWPNLETLIFRCNHGLRPVSLQKLSSLHKLRRLYLFNHELSDQLRHLLPHLPDLQLLDVRSARSINNETVDFLLDWVRTKRINDRFHLLISDRTRIDLRRYELRKSSWPQLTIHRLCDWWPFVKYAMIMHENFRHFYENI